MNASSPSGAALEASSPTEDSTATLAVSGVVTGLSALCVALRFFVRIRMKVHLGWDDWWCLIGLLSTLVAGALLLAGNSIDPDGAHFSTVAANNPTATFDYAAHRSYLTISYTSSVSYFLCIAAIKTSIVLLYRRVFSIDTSFRLQSLVVIIFIWVFWFAATIATILNCLPFEYNWISIGDPLHCINYNIFWMVTGSIEVLMDAIILALPVRMVLGLQLTRKRKILVLLIFLLGGLYVFPLSIIQPPLSPKVRANLFSVIITGTLRVIYGYVPGSRLPSYGLAELWSAVHIGTAIICACLPPLRPLFFRASASKPSNGFSSARRRYYSIQDWAAKGVGSTGESNGSRNGNTVEAIPLRSQESQPSRVKVPRTETMWLPEER
ncbi:hypothetical protein MMC30_003227 [Trapelia coarctata]|nr:hypothetical protein [Trapelia coarctata]